MMNKYSKINAIGNKSQWRSMDFSDPLTFPDSTSNFNKPKEANQIVESPNKAKNSNTIQYPLQEPDQEVGKGEGLGGKLKRSSSVSSASGLQTAVKRMLSLKRSSSVSERYCRIHDQSATLSSPTRIDEEELTVETRRSMSKKNRTSRGSILRTCKKLFGL